MSLVLEIFAGETVIWIVEADRVRKHGDTCHKSSLHHRDSIKNDLFWEKEWRFSNSSISINPQGSPERPSSPNSERQLSLDSSLDRIEHVYH
jgi:predicted amidohydrolase